MSWNVHYDQIMHRRDVGCRILSERLKKEILEEIWVRADAPHNSPLKRRQGNWNRNASRNWFWDRYWGPCHSAIGQFFLTVPEVFAKDRLTRPSSLLGEYRPGVTRSQVLTAYNVYRFISLCQDCFIFFPNMLVMPTATTSLCVQTKPIQIKSPYDI